MKPTNKGSLKACFRIRNKDGKYFITYKKDVFDKLKKWLYSDEYETEILNFKIAQEIVKNLGLKKISGN